VIEPSSLSPAARLLLSIHTLLVFVHGPEHIVAAHESDNGYPSSRDDENVLLGKLNEQQH
jgi:hypothetical protein